MKLYLRVCAEINLDAAAYNLRNMKKNLEPETKIIAVVKTDGYGHGAVPIAHMAEELDYISPMIYPSHYADGNFGIDHPDTRPYDTIRAAMDASTEDLNAVWSAGGSTAAVRPWLQAFTASYLDHYIDYGPEEIRQQIQAVYDSGYEEWLLWNASVRYDSGGLLTEEEADLEAAAR